MCFMDFIPYNSRNTLHKSKFGALKQGENVVFKVIMPRSFGVNDSKGKLRHCHDKFRLYQENDSR